MSSESSDPNEPIKFFLVLKQNRTAVKKLETIFWKITDPDSNEYQRWLTRSKINAILTLDNKVLTAVKRWLREQSFPSVTLLGTDVFEIQTTVGHVSKCFSAEFHPYKNSKTRKTIHRTRNEICLPEEISRHIDFWLGLNDFLSSNGKPIGPSKIKIDIRNDRTTMDAGTTQVYPMIVPQFVLSYYKIQDVLKTGLSSDVSQGSLQFIDQFYSEQDLQDYSKAVGIPFKPLKKNHILGIDDQSDPGIETMIDVEQMVGIDPLAETWYINYDAKNISGDDWLSNFVAVNQLDDLPQVLSISYGETEAGPCTLVTNCKEKVVNLLKRYFSRTNMEIMKLTMRGISVLIASGDDGANDYLADCTNKVLYPDYPSSSPFVTAVGATTLVNVKYQPLQNQPPACTDLSSLYTCVSGGDEIAVSYDDPLLISFTSGGGFSNFASQPYYQKDAVNHYFRDKQYYINKNSEYYPPSSMYNRNGRAYPDVAALGVNDLIVVNGSVVQACHHHCGLVLSQFSIRIR